MTSASALEYRARDEVFRWPLCAMAVLALHALGFAVLIAWQTQPTPSDAPAAMVMIELEPAPVLAIPPPPPVETSVVLPEDPIVPPVATSVAEPEIALPPPSRPKPVPRNPQRAEKQPKVSPVVDAEPSESGPSAAPPPNAPAAATPDSMTDFQRRLMAQLDRAKRYPPAAQRRRVQGVAYLRFTMDRSGKVLAAVLERSSGHGDLDDEVLALIKRADPLPTFPPEMVQDRLELVVPVQFSLR